jgi:hypothetical protein
MEVNANLYAENRQLSIQDYMVCIAAQSNACSVTYKKSSGAPNDYSFSLTYAPDALPREENLFSNKILYSKFHPSTLVGRSCSFFAFLIDL